MSVNTSFLIYIASIAPMNLELRMSLISGAEFVTFVGKYSILKIKQSSTSKNMILPVMFVTFVV